MRKRLDVLLVERGVFESREKAKTAIMAGEITVDGQVFDKPGMSVAEEADIVHRGDKCPYVSLDGAICMDIGASTGGFTDCMLQNGASKVYSIDVGYGQLDYRLRTDPRVVNIEKCNFRNFEDNPENSIVVDDIDFTSIDVSFISLKLIFPKCAEFLNDGGMVCALIKPQFEAGREQVGKNGIVKDPKVHMEVISNVIEYAKASGLTFGGLDFSPVQGAKGNIEYLLLLNKKEQMGYNEMSDIIKETVFDAHSSFNKKTIPEDD